MAEHPGVGMRYAIGMVQEFIDTELPTAENMRLLKELLELVRRVNALETLEACHRDRLGLESTVRCLRALTRPRPLAFPACLVVDNTRSAS